MIPPNLRATAATSRRSLRTLRGTAATAPAAAAHHAPPYRYAGSRLVDFDDLTVTENTRCAYPLQAIPNAKLPAIGSHPTNVVLLTCDGFGVLPPVSKLTPEQARARLPAARPTRRRRPRRRPPRRRRLTPSLPPSSPRLR